MAKYSFLLIALMASCALTYGSNFDRHFERAMDTCGKPKVEMLPGDKHTEAAAGSHPWVVSIQKNDKHLCNGALLQVGDKDESDIVVSTASCIFKALEADKNVTLAAVFGAKDLDKAEAGQQKIMVKEHVMNEDYHYYSGKHTANNIVIYKLASPVKFSSTIQPVCLPKQGEIVPDDAEGKLAYWHLRNDDEYKASTRPLMQIGAKILNTQDCVKRYSTMFTKLQAQDTICTSTTDIGLSANMRDQAGPLVIKNGQVYVLQGLIYRREQITRPTIIVRVSTYVDWIGKAVKIIDSL